MKREEAHQRVGAALQALLANDKYRPALVCSPRLVPE